MMQVVHCFFIHKAGQSKKNGLLNEGGEAVANILSFLIYYENNWCRKSGPSFCWWEILTAKKKGALTHKIIISPGF